MHKNIIEKPEIWHFCPRKYHKPEEKINFATNSSPDSTRKWDSASRITAKFAHPRFTVKEAITPLNIVVNLKG